jgi:hypothetical protein
MKNKLTRLCSKTRKPTIGVIVAIVVAVWVADAEAHLLSKVYQEETISYQGVKE